MDALSDLLQGMQVSNDSLDDISTLTCYANILVEEITEFTRDETVPTLDDELAIVSQLFYNSDATLVALNSVIAHRIGERSVASSTRRINVYNEASEALSSLNIKRNLIQELLPPISENLVKCCACLEKMESKFKAECGHDHCASCLREILMAALSDTSLLPKRCCGTLFDLEVISALNVLSVDEMSLLQEKTQEITSENPLYCTNAACSAFIVIETQQSGDDTVLCGKCMTRVCVLCKGDAHPSSDCPKIVAENAILEIARDAGWRQCFRCCRMVELSGGCNHMTCVCRAQFCYVCGVQWKNCTCAQWDEANLLATAARRAPVRRNQEVALQEDVLDMADHLRNNHMCTHPGRWNRVDSPGRNPVVCELCGAVHWLYLLECRRCFLRACVACRRTRV